jgi:hypothetical protein
VKSLFQRQDPHQSASLNIDAGRVRDCIDKNFGGLKMEYYSPKRRNLRVGILFYEIKITGVL